MKNCVSIHILAWWSFLDDDFGDSRGVEEKTRPKIGSLPADLRYENSCCALFRNLTDSWFSTFSNQCSTHEVREERLRHVSNSCCWILHGIDEVACCCEIGRSNLKLCKPRQPRFQFHQPPKSLKIIRITTKVDRWFLGMEQPKAGSAMTVACWWSVGAWWNGERCWDKPCFPLFSCCSSKCR